MTGSKTVTVTKTNAQVKVDPYKKRNENSIPAPLEDSDDSEFAAGPIKEEITKKKNKRDERASNKRTKKWETAGRPSKRRKLQPQSMSKDDGPSFSDSENDHNILRRSRSRALSHVNANPLARFFAEWGLSEETDADDEAQEDEEALCSDEEDTKQYSQQAHISKTLAVLVTLDQKTSQSVSLSGTTDKANPESSHTEDESSHTEDESEPLIQPIAVDGGSSTESEDSEDEFPQAYQYDKASKSNPRPAFQRPPSSVRAPLVLDTISNQVQVPASINVFLRDYQREGIKFFYKHYKENRGALLGDDMGLGKTVQVISFLSAIMGKTGFDSDNDRRRDFVRVLQDRKSWRTDKKLPPANGTWPTCLIIGPTSVMYNWERELETWGYFEVGMYLGPDREHVLNDFKLGRLDVVLTSFETATKDIELLDTLAWSCIFVDEVHRAKNLLSKTSIAFHQFQCRRRFGLTGTAIQNSYDELYAILHWTNPERIGDPEHWKFMISDPLRAGQSNTATDEEKARALVVADIVVREILPDFFLRRTKDLIKDQLPTKSERVVFCPLAPTQLAAYKRILECDEVQHLINRNNPCDCGSGEILRKCCHPFVPENMLRYMAVLIALSNHLGLILPREAQTEEKREQSRKLVQHIFPQTAIPNQAEVELNPRYCGKWQVLKSLLEDMRKDSSNKVLIFTKSVQLMKILDTYLKMQRYGHLCFSGETPQKERMGIIDKFHSDPEIFVFLISTMAGGTGLNLVGANKVVIFDPHWNPAHDLQAMDRAYRIGQTRPVEIYRLLGAGSLEELIYACQVYKQQQMAIGYEASIQTRYFEGVKNDRRKQGELFGLKNIFKLDEKNFTKLAIEKANQRQLDWAFGNINSKQFKEDESDAVNMAGLDELLLAEPEQPHQVQKEKSKAEQILNSAGVAYTHHNEEVIRQNEIEVKKAKELLKQLKLSGNRAARKSLLGGVSRRGSRRHSGSSSKSKSEGVVSDPDKRPWPPKRGRLQKKLTAEEQAEERYEALLDRGDIDCMADIKTKLLPKFIKLTGSAQQEYFRILDEYSLNMKKERQRKAAQRAQDSDSD
ncbi:hypothetical protein GYMLUDRAFT_47369 [Collybiopsis luxurians FD-317 M1]|uniref:Uncharacterized protein n=1 Tax=Collybiopsis luxurians FD-317 M1 TaxID=944289 RepID=A0A0D0C1D2_9AGAR|nr:hypothetical protein GYMLUDRAFT_47369 [Collybiopsis luxurians FD-317 M1]